MNEQARNQTTRALARLYADATAATAADRIALRALEDRVDGRGRTRRGSFLVLGALALVGAAAVIVTTQMGPLTFTVGMGGERAAGGAIRSITETPVPITFSDGTVLTLEQRASGRLNHVDRHGARFVLERGRVAARVVHRSGARWFVHAGPFEVVVTGTTFDVDWASEPERLGVALHTGSVTVRGPLMGDGMRLEPGQSLVVDLRRGDVRVKAAGAPEPSEATPFPAAPPAPVPQPRASVPQRPTPSIGPAPDRWSDELQAGRFAEVVQAAEARGLARVYRTAPAHSLRALADAARYHRRPTVARGALEAVRARFPRARASADAAFFLGWLADEEGNAARALSWYDRALQEAPRGAYAEQALGRQMLLVQRTSGAVNAAPLADAYLARFPRGAYAEAARRIRASR